MGDAFSMMGDAFSMVVDAFSMMGTAISMMGAAIFNDLLAGNDCPKFLSIAGTLLKYAVRSLLHPHVAQCNEPPPKFRLPHCLGMQRPQPYA
jgi:hypothetical protein